MQLVKKARHDGSDNERVLKVRVAIV